MVIKVGEKQRYGVPGFVVSGVTFGEGQIIIEVAGDVIEASRNVYNHDQNNRSNLGPIVGLGSQGTFMGFEDLFYMDKRVVAPWIDISDVDMDPNSPVEVFVSSLRKVLGRNIIYYPLLLRRLLTLVSLTLKTRR